MVRVLVSIVLGAAVTFGLFVFMNFLISGGPKRVDNESQNIVIDMVMAKPKMNTVVRHRTPPPPPPPPKAPPKVQQVQPDQSNTGGGISLNVPSVSLANDGLAIDAPVGGLSRDGEATPIVRIEPRYPISAARDGKEGWVKMRFTIDPVGNTTDIEVLDSDPPRVFDREAIRALRKWKYKPKVVDGKAVPQPGIVVQLDFKLDNSR